MKKAYIAPALMVQEIAVQEMIALSVMGASTFANDTDALGRGQIGDWDDEENEW